MIGTMSAEERKEVKEWRIGQPIPYEAQEDLIHVPPYWDGYMGFGGATIQRAKIGGYIVTNSYGELRGFDEFYPALNFLLEV
jgi:hypothetical protein